MACIFCFLKDLINSNLHKLAEMPLSHCFSVCCGKNSLIALSDSLFCAKWIHTAVYAHIFRKYFFQLPERPKHLPPQPTQAYRKEICRFFAAISQKFHGRMPWEHRTLPIHGQKTPPAIRKTANWPAPTYTLTTKSFANASTRIFSKKRSGNFPNTF